MSITVWILLFICSICSVLGVKYSARCSNSTDKGITFEPASDGVDGRYKIEWCSARKYDNNPTWDLTIYHDDNRPEAKCQRFNSSMLIKYGDRHSHTEIKVDSECTNVCLTTYQDLIFNGTCYHIKSGFKYGAGRSSHFDNALFYIKNQFPKEHFTESKTYFTHEKLSDQELVVWLTGNIPVTDYNILLCNNTECQFMGVNCSTETAYKISCRIHAPVGSYDVGLVHVAPWTGAQIFEKVKNYNHALVVNNTIHPEVWSAVGGGVSPLVWVGAAAVAAGALLLLLVVARTARRRRRRNPDTVVDSQEPVIPKKYVATGSRVLLIYARDCPPFTRAVQILATALRRTGCQVIDIFSSEAVAASAAAPGEWVRRLAADPATRLLLLQSPAAAALYAAQLKPSATLSAPLLGRAAVRRAPHTADGIAMIALRMLGEAAHRPLAYRKCYVASINGLESELVPGVTPQRRYVLPAYAEVLLRDLAPEGSITPIGPEHPTDGPITDPTKSPDFSDILHDLTVALQEMCDYVHNNPNYLTDDLLYI